MEIATDENFIYIRGMSETQASRLDAVWLRGSKAWRLPLNTFALRELWKSFPTDEIEKLGKKIAGQELVILHHKDYEYHNNDIDSRLRPYQVTDINFLR